MSDRVSAEVMGEVVALNLDDPKDRLINWANEKLIEVDFDIAATVAQITYQHAVLKAVVDGSHAVKPHHADALLDSAQELVAQVVVREERERMLKRAMGMGAL